MAQENYVEGCSMQRPPFLEPNGFCFWKASFETYDIEKKQLGKNEEAKMTIYNALPSKEYERVFMCKTIKEVWHTLIITHQGNSQVKNCKIDLLTQEYEKFSISNKETIDSGFTRFNAIVTSLKSLDPDYSSKNHVRKFLCALLLKWRAKVTPIEEAKDLATLPLDELIGNIKVYKMVLDNDGVASKTIKEKVKSLALKAKVTRDQTSDDSDSQGGSDGEEAMEKKPKHSICWLGTSAAVTTLETKVAKSRSQREHATIATLKAISLVNVESRRKTWRNIEDGDEQLNDETCLMAIDSQEVVSKPSNSNINLNYIDLQKENEELLNKINDLEIEVEKLVNDKEVIEHCQKCVELTQMVDSLRCNVSKLQNEAFNFSKFKVSSIALDDMISRQKMSQDKEGLGFSKNDKTTSMSPNRPIVFVKESQKENSSTSFVISIIPQSFFVNTRGSQAPINEYKRTIKGYSQTSKAYIVLNKETMRIEESLNVTFDESLPEPKSSSSVEDDRIDEPIVQDLNRSPSLS
ncbi:hypothetical protein Tco_1063109 [Tanacetum coccineum]